LPRQAKFIFEPAASAFFSSCGKFLPKIIHFFLRFAVDEERDGFGEFELRAGIDGVKLLPREFKCAAQTSLSVSRHKPRKQAGGLRYDSTFPPAL
jgi:hypothetical protein